LQHALKDSVLTQVLRDVKGRGHLVRWEGSIKVDRRDVKLGHRVCLLGIESSGRALRSSQRSLNKRADNCLIGKRL
jgi:hypothetical protein